MPRKSRIDRLFEELPKKARDDFFSFLDQLGLSSDSRMLVIPSTHHFFYDAEELKEVKTVVNLRQLNHIREIKDFLRTVSDLLPPKSSFVGCFVDNKTSNGLSDRYSNLPGYDPDKTEAYENGIESRIPFINRMYSFMDLRTNRYLTRRSVTSLLMECGLRVAGMKELNGITYFCTQKILPAV
ncbi:hypothetical protein EG832_08270 [bacterium]|nr:hypothetical protein [bacterium]